MVRECVRRIAPTCFDTADGLKKVDSVWWGAMRRLVFSLFISASVLAAPFKEDFESGHFLTSESPSGDWEPSYPPPVGSSFNVVQEAAHRGRYGLRSIDGTIGTGSGVVMAGSRYLGGVGGEQHARFWFRVRHLIQAEETTMFQLSGEGVNSLLDVWLDGAGRELHLSGADRASYVGDLEAAYRPGEWALIEVALTGLDSTSGTRTLWVNGARASHRAGLDYSNVRALRLNLGEPYGQRDFLGSIDVDDFRYGPAPHGSTLLLHSDSAELQVGECRPWSIVLRTSDGAEAPAPYPVEVALSHSGSNAAFYSDSECARATASVELAPGVSSATAYFSASGLEPLSLSATHPDFLSRSEELSVVDRPKQRLFDFGCGCASNAGADLVLGLMTAAYAFAALVRTSRPVKRI